MPLNQSDNFFHVNCFQWTWPSFLSSRLIPSALDYVNFGALFQCEIFCNDFLNLNSSKLYSNFIWTKIKKNWIQVKRFQKWFLVNEKLNFLLSVHQNMQINFFLLESSSSELWFYNSYQSISLKHFPLHIHTLG